MLDVILPKKALDYHYGYDHPLRFDALEVFFYPNFDNDYKTWYIIHIANEWANRDWKYWPVTREELHPLEIKVGGTQGDDLPIHTPYTVLQFGQVEPIEGLAAKEETQRLKNLSTMSLHSHHTNYHPTEKERIWLPIRFDNMLLEYDEVKERYK